MLHVHVCEGHDHPDHHQGPAAHSHGAEHHQRHAEASATDHAAVHLEPCDPGEHAVAVTFTWDLPASHQAPHVASTVAVGPTPSVQSRCRVTPSDVNAHSPPRLTDAPLRAPPVVRPA